jgi:hypothetical protein
MMWKRRAAAASVDAASGPLPPRRELRLITVSEGHLVVHQDGTLIAQRTCSTRARCAGLVAFPRHMRNKLPGQPPRD